MTAIHPKNNVKKKMKKTIYIYVWLTLVLPQLFSQRAVLASVVRPFTASNALPFIRWPNRIQTCQTCIINVTKMVFVETVLTVSGCIMIVRFRIV